MLGASAGGPGTAVLMALILAALGWIAPEYMVSAKARTRREQIRAAMPDALDLLAVSVEAGLGFDASISKIQDRRNTVLFMDAPKPSIRLSRNRLRGTSKLSARPLIDDAAGVFPEPSRQQKGPVFPPGLLHF